MLESEQSGSCEEQNHAVYMLQHSLPLTSNTQVQLGHDSHISNALTHGQMVADISNMQDAGISLERSAAAGEGQRELSCQSCMQQAVQYHITSTNPTSHSFSSTRNWNARKLLCKVILQNQIWLQSELFYNLECHTVYRSCVTQVRLKS